MRHPKQRRYALRGYYLIFFVCCAGIVSAVPAKKKIEVSDSNRLVVGAPSAEIITDRLRTELFKEGGYVLLERNAMQEVRLPVTEVKEATKAQNENK